MKPNFTRIALAAALQISSIVVCSAQSQTAAFPTLPTPAAKIVVDGNVKEWGDSLQYYNKENKINYSIANDKENIYVAVCIKDRVQQIRTLNAGMTFAVDPKGKKKNSYTITFPLKANGNTDFDFRTVNMGPVTPQDRETLTNQKALYLRGIKVDGFKDLENGILKTTDSGILATVNYDEHGYLVCEAVIPLKLFHADDLYKNEWAFNLKINSLTRPAAPSDANDAGNPVNAPSVRNSGLGRSSSNRGSGNLTPATGLTPAGPSALYHSDDFWAKFYLAK